MTETEARRLYRATCTDYGRSIITFPSWSESDVSFLEATATGEGWAVELRIPDRTALQNYVVICEERGLQFRLRLVYEERAAGTGVETQLTERQRKTLLVAHELGYFDIPRRASLADVAAECEVTPQATSERLRRATGNLVETTLVPKTA